MELGFYAVPPLWSLLWRELIRLLVKAAELGIKNLFKSTLKIKKCNEFQFYQCWQAFQRATEQWSRKYDGQYMSL